MPPVSPRTATARRTRILAATCAAFALLLFAVAPAARAAYDVTVSAAPTARGALVGDVFTPNDDDAVLNVADANGQLAIGDLWIVSGAGGSQDGDIDIAEPLTGPGRQLRLRPSGTLSAAAGIEVGTLVLDGAGEVTGLVSGTGSLVKTGAGDHRLVADNTYTGATTVLQGELQVDGAQADSAVELDGGTLAGNGTVGPVTQADDASIVAPGDAAPGTLATGSLTLGSCAPSQVACTTLAFEVDGAAPGEGAGHHDRLTVTGTVALDGAQLALALGTPPPIGAPLILVDNDGADPVTGTFLDLPEGAVTWIDGVPLRISYTGGDGNDVTVTAQRAPSEVELMQSEPWTMVGAPLTLTAIVVVDVAPPFPSGTITFASDGVAIGSAPLDPTNGIASIATTALPVGRHAITATYSGDAITDGSRSLPTPHEVRALTPPPPPPPPDPRDDGRRDETGDGGPGDGGGQRDPGGRRDGARPSTPVTPPRVVRQGHPRVVRHGRTLVITTGFALACPRGDRACTASVALQSRRRRDGRRVTIGRGSARVRAGRTGGLTLRTDRRSAPRLARGQRERVTVTVTARTGRGTPVTTRRVVRMRLQRRG